MKKSKKSKVLSIEGIIIVVILLLGIIIINYDNTEHTVLEDQEKQISATSSISMMLETGASSGIYEVSTDTSWPTSGYTFNSTLSKCENGSSLSWDNANGQVIMSGNVSDKCYVYFDVEVFTLAGAISTFTADGTSGLYYFDGEGDYTNADLEVVDYSYRYVGGTYVLTSTATSDGYTTIDDISSSTNTGVINFYCSRGNSYSYIGGRCSSSYTGYFYLNYDAEVTQYSTYREAAEQAVTDGYLEYGVKNYICFGSDAETCSDDNLYRIIGFFLNDAGEYEMKIIKADGATSTQLGTDGDYYKTYYSSWSAYRSDYKGNTSLSSVGAYYWNYVNYQTAYDSNGGYYNDWSYSQLNTVNLNTNYYNNLDSTWQNMISEHTWIIGGGPSSTSEGVYAMANVGYSYEIENPSNQLGYTIYTSNVGLMYVSDYGYAALPTYWTTDINTYDATAIREGNWMYNGVYEWTISRSSTTATYAFSVDAAGSVGNGNGANIGDVVRPVLYLVSSVTISGGSGSLSDPYRLQT